MTTKPVKFDIIITNDAEDDLEHIYEFLIEHADPQFANQTLDELERAIKTLDTFPNRGSYPKELVDLGIVEFRQLIYQRYRVIYRVIGQLVSIQLIADGRQDMQTLLTRRVMRVHSRSLN